MNRKKNRRITNILLLLVLVVFGAYILNSKSEESKFVLNGHKGQIEYIEGEVEKRTDDSGWEIIEKGEVIKSGDEIRTLDESRLIVTFEDGSVLRLDENTSTKIESSENKITILLDKGTIFNKVSKSDTREYSVESGEYQIIALGTEFSVEKETELSTKVMVLESEVEIRDKDGEMIEKIETGKKASVDKKEVKKDTISTTDKKDEFIAWSISGEDEAGKYVEEVVVNDDESDDEEEVVVPTSKISIWGEKTSKGVKINWSVNGVDVSKGFKLVKSTSMNPVYPGDDYKYLSDSGQRSYEWNITTGKGYYFRVCQYLGGKCGVYSKNLYLKTPTGDSGSGSVTDMSLSIGSTGDGYINLNWDVTGNSSKGFKLVYSTNENPVYPGNTYKYFSDSNKRSFKWEGNFEAGQKYYFRVCEYLGGKCGVYSNNVSHTFSGSSGGGDEYATDLSLSVSGDDDYVTLNWTVGDGGTPKGFKAIYSKNSNPEYPTRPGDTYQYLGNSGTRSAKWSRSKFEDGETYHFRVCVYKGGVCGAYSNDVSVSF